MRLEKRPRTSPPAYVAAPVGAVAFTLLVSTLLVLWAGAPVGQTYALLARGAFGSVFALTETLTRVPIGAPLVSGPQDPLLQKLVGATFLVFLVGMVLQVRALRRGRVQLAHPAT